MQPDTAANERGLLAASFVAKPATSDLSPGVQEALVPAGDDLTSAELLRACDRARHWGFSVSRSGRKKRVDTCCPPCTRLRRPRSKRPRPPQRRTRSCKFTHDFTAHNEVEWLAPLKAAVEHGACSKRRGVVLLGHQSPDHCTPGSARRNGTTWLAAKRFRGSLATVCGGSSAAPRCCRASTAQHAPSAHALSPGPSLTVGQRAAIVDANHVTLLGSTLAVLRLMLQGHEQQKSAVKKQASGPCR